MKRKHFYLLAFLGCAVLLNMGFLNCAQTGFEVRDLTSNISPEGDRADHPSDDNGEISPPDSPSSNVISFKQGELSILPFGVASVPIELDESQDQDVTVLYSTRAGSALAGEDFIETSGEIIIPAGETKVFVPVSIVSKHLPSADKSFGIHLSLASDASGSQKAGLSPTFSSANLVKINGKTEAASSVTVTNPNPPRLYSGFRQVSLGGQNFSCALNNEGRVYCWGSGPMGANVSGMQSRPRLVEGVSEATALEVGHDHVCALIGGGSLKCWGGNGAGQIRSGVNTVAPTEVVGLGGRVTKVSAGFAATCVVVEDGRVQCWGGNSSGQLGDGTTTPRTQPTDVVDLGGVANDVSAGEGFACALLSDGVVKCWGTNNYGQLGDGSTQQRLRPVTVQGLSGIVQISAGTTHACALSSGGEVFCWGKNTDGQIGDGTTTAANRAVRVLSGASVVTAGYASTCAALSAGGMRCWGYNGYGGQLGDLTDTGRKSPVEVHGIAQIVNSIGVAYGHTCAVDDDGGVLCWGNNDQGELGTGSFATRAYPVDVHGVHHQASAISLAAETACVVQSSNVKCWGQGYLGQLGQGRKERRYYPVVADRFGTGVVKTAHTRNSTCAVYENGDVKCLGNNDSGDFGTGASGASLDAVRSQISGVRDIVGGSAHFCVLDNDGYVSCVGNNTNTGALGDSTTTSRSTYARVPGLSGGHRALAAGPVSNCAITADEGVICWGSTPTRIDGLGSPVSAIAVGSQHACAVTTRGTVSCWGQNGSWQLGRSSPSSSVNTALEVEGLRDVRRVAAGEAHTCALLSNGSVKCWGRNQNNELGNGTKTNSAQPVDVAGLNLGVVDLVVHGKTTCARTTSGAVKCWGSNANGITGDTNSDSVPQNILAP